MLKIIFPYLERLFRPFRTDARQDFLLGRVSPGHLIALIQHVYSCGFEDQIFAWVDDGQIASLRKKDGDFQYHLRIFDDGEVRGHYEYAPEIAPIKHLRRVGREARAREFLGFIGQHIQPTREHLPIYHDTFSTVMQAVPHASYRS